MLKRFVPKVNRILLLLSLIVGVALFAAPSSYANETQNVDVYEDWITTGNNLNSSSYSYYKNGEKQTSDFTVGPGDDFYIYITFNGSVGKYSSSFARYDFSVKDSLGNYDVSYFVDSNFYIYLFHNVRIYPVLTGTWTIHVYESQKISYMEYYSASTASYMACAAIQSLSRGIDVIHDDIVDQTSRLVSELEASNNWLMSIDNTNYSIDQTLTELRNNNSFKTGGTFLGAKTTIDGSYLTSNTSISSHTKTYFDYRCSSYNTAAYKITIPFRVNRSIDNNAVHINSLKYYINGNYQNEYYHYSFYSLPNENGFDVYLFDFLPWSTASSSVYTFEIEFDYAGTVYYNRGSIKYLLADTFEYALLRMQFQTNDIKEAVAPDNYLAAERESQEVIDDTLDGFTGDGSAAIKKSQTSSMKGLSSDLQSGLDGGGSVGDATQVFSSGSDLWQWFSTQNKNDINQLYVPGNRRNLRKSASPQGEGWEIIDAITPNEQEYRDHLVGGDR